MRSPLRSLRRAETSRSSGASRRGPRRRATTLAALVCVGALAVGAVSWWGPSDPAPEATAPNESISYPRIPRTGPAPEFRIKIPKPKQTSRARRAPAAPGSPQRLVIPALGVDSAVVPVSAPDGVLTPPGDAQQVGWWSDGAEPGARQGSALVTGHTLSRGGAALQELGSLESGDRIAVRTVKGRISYRVRTVRTFSKTSVATHAEQLFSQASPGRLVVITCEDYNGSTYLSNVVVTATPRSRPGLAARPVLGTS